MILDLKTWNIFDFFLCDSQKHFRKMSMNEDDMGVMNLCQEVEMGVGKRQRKAKVFDDDNNQQVSKKKKIVKKVQMSKNKEPDRKEKDTKLKVAKPRERRKVVFIPAPIESKVLPSVALSHINKATQLVLSEDQMTCFGCEVYKSTIN